MHMWAVHAKRGDLLGRERQIDEIDGRIAADRAGRRAHLGRGFLGASHRDFAAVL